VQRVGEGVINEAVSTIVGCWQPMMIGGGAGACLPKGCTCAAERIRRATSCNLLAVMVPVAADKSVAVMTL
jgi:hypothetical protein